MPERRWATIRSTGVQTQPSADAWPEVQLPPRACFERCHAQALIGGPQFDVSVPANEGLEPLLRRKKGKSFILNRLGLFFSDLPSALPMLPTASGSSSLRPFCR